MLTRHHLEMPTTVATLDDLTPLADYSLMDTLNCDPEGKANGADQRRQTNERTRRHSARARKVLHLPKI